MTAVWPCCSIPVVTRDDRLRLLHGGRQCDRCQRAWTLRTATRAPCWSSASPTLTSRTARSVRPQHLAAFACSQPLQATVPVSVKVTPPSGCTDRCACLAGGPEDGVQRCRTGPRPPVRPAVVQPAGLQVHIWFACRLACARHQLRATAVRLRRALNQAIGRCIRHRGDFGAIVLLDDRFRQPVNQKHLSRW